MTDPLQNVTTSTYDYRGRPTQQVDALKSITAFSYVATGCPSCGGGGEKLTSLTDAAGSTTNFAYELRGLLTSVTDPLQKVTSLTYDVNGRATSRTDRDGTTLGYAYTPAGMLATITYPDSSQTTNTYDSLNRLTQLNDSIGSSSFNYDADGRVTSFTDADGFTLAYGLRCRREHHTDHLSGYEHGFLRLRCRKPPDRLPTGWEGRQSTPTTRTEDSRALPILTGS